MDTKRYQKGEVGAKTYPGVMGEELNNKETA